MLFRQLFDVDTSTYTYLLADPQSREAIIIDPVIGQRARDLALKRLTRSSAVSRHWGVPRLAPARRQRWS